MGIGTAFLVIALLLALAVGGSFLVSRYNSFVQVHENVDKAWANIEVILKQRREELPSLIEAAQHFLEEEKDVLEAMTAARTAVQEASGPREEADADQQLRGALARLFAVAEDYPELQSSNQFTQLQERISALEERIADRREFYNEAATIFNARIRQIPDVLFAQLLDLEARELFEAEGEELKDVDVGDRLNDRSSRTSA